jgi:hypothetical protein
MKYVVWLITDGFIRHLVDRLQDLNKIFVAAEVTDCNAYDVNSRIAFVQHVGYSDHNRRGIQLIMTNRDSTHIHHQATIRNTKPIKCCSNALLLISTIQWLVFSMHECKGVTSYLVKPRLI